MKNFNKKGFTLVELLAVIVILGIISVLGMVFIDNMLDHSREVECDAVLVSIKNAAKEYVSDNRYTFDDVSAVGITVTKLIDYRYLNSIVKNPFTNKKLETEEKDNITAYMELNSDYSIKSIEIINSLGSIIKCHIEDKEIDDDVNVVLFPG